MFDLKIIAEVVKSFGEQLKKQNEINLIATVAANLYCNGREGEMREINAACLKAKEIINTAKTIVGA